MAQVSWPSPEHNDRVVTDAEYEAIAARFSDDGVLGGPDDDSVVDTPGGLRISVRAGKRASLRGHAWYAGDTDDVVPIDPNDAGEPRTDLVVLRLDRSRWTVRAVVKKGTPGAGAPALVRDPGDTGVWEMRLATVTVPAGATSVQVTPAEEYVGSRVRPARSLNGEPALTHPALGEIQFEPGTPRWLGWDGSRWRTLHTYETEELIDLPDAGEEGGGEMEWERDYSSFIVHRAGTAHLRLSGMRCAVREIPADQDTRLPVEIPPHLMPPRRHQFALVYLTGHRVGRLRIYYAGEPDVAGQVWLSQHPGLVEGNYLYGQSVSWAVD